MNIEEIYKKLPADTITRIHLDAGLGITPEKSSLKYDDDMLAVREDYLKWFENLPEGAVAELPKL